MKVLSEDDVVARISKLKIAEADKKVDLIQSFGLEIEQVSELPSSTIDPLILLLPPLIRSSHSLLQISTLTSFLPFFLELIPLQPTTHLRLSLLQILPALLEKLNDSKERIYSASSNSILILGKKSFESDPPSPTTTTTTHTLNGSSSSLASSSKVQNVSAVKVKEKETLSQIFERYLKDTLNSKSWRSKVEILKLIIKLKSELGSKFSLKGWLSILVDLLEDSDGNVREQAKETVVALLSPASTPAAARSELKKLLLARNVRKTISNDIVARVIGGGAVESGRSTPAIQSSGAETPKEDQYVNGKPSVTASSSIPNSSGTGDEVDVVYLASPHDVSNELAAMLPHFEGKETEHNWAPREKAVVRIRGMLRGGVWPKFNEAFIQGLKNGILEGVLKTIVSLRTTVAQQSCYLMKELAETLGPSFDQFVEHLLPILAKMAGYTKKIIADRSQACVSAIIIHTHVHSRLFIAHIAAGVSDKNVQTRHYSTGHLKTFLDIHGNKSKHTIETTPGLSEQLEGSVKKSLADVNPGVRDLARQAFWSYYSIWKQKAEAIINSLDGMQRKQLEKANPHDSNGIVVPPTTTSKAAPPAKRATSTMSALLAEKRKAKAAELAAGKMAQESPRIVSGPVPGSPSLQQGIPRSNSSASVSERLRRPELLEEESPEPSPHDIPLPSTPGPVGTSTPTPAQRAASRRSVPPSLGSPRDLLSQTREKYNNLNMGSPSKGSPNRDSPLRQSSIPRTPQSIGRPLHSSANETETGLGLRTPARMERSVSHEAEADLGDNVDWISGTPPQGISLPPGNGVVDEARRAQIAQAESAAQQLMEYDDDENTNISTSTLNSPGNNPNVPITPIRSTTNGRPHGNGIGSAYKTPLNANSRKIWEDSPRPEAVTPLMMDRLKERKHERSWWVKRQELMDKASPLKSTTPSTSSAVTEDIRALSSGQPSLRNLQKIALFSTSHPVHNEDGLDGESSAEEEKKVWSNDGTFEKILQGLLRFLEPDQNKELLEQGLVVLWEMVQHQWVLFDGHEQELVEALFRLRESHDATILESTNALVSLLTQISDPIYFLTLLRSSLEQFLNEHPSPYSTQENVQDGMSNSESNTSNHSDKEKKEKERIRNSGWLFGLTSLGMCILKLPEPVILVEGNSLGKIIEQSINNSNSPNSSSLIRQSSYNLLLSIQVVLKKFQKTLSFVPNLNKGQKDLLVYYMEKNGLLEHDYNHDFIENKNKNQSDDDSSNNNNNNNVEEEKDQIDREKMLKEMEGLMGRGILRE
ncbi:uncharacterized protein L201_003054 [Kwoniella dendrophila CBS 6074]|uniref:TOG domain-containing protein n=1 Tax=Kwoniella dendrophila CBS 6074 TaxID=1295534 RepID=A0AAX4JTK5_9TREE